MRVSGTLYLPQFPTCWMWLHMVRWSSNFEHPVVFSQVFPFVSQMVITPIQPFQFHLRLIDGVPLSIDWFTGNAVLDHLVRVYMVVAGWPDGHCEISFNSPHLILIPQALFQCLQNWQQNSAQHVKFYRVVSILIATHKQIYSIWFLWLHNMTRYHCMWLSMVVFQRCSLLTRASMEKYLRLIG